MTYSLHGVVVLIWICVGGPNSYVLRSLNSGCENLLVKHRNDVEGRCRGKQSLAIGTCRQEVSRQNAHLYLVHNTERERFPVSLFLVFMPLVFMRVLNYSLL